MQQRGTLATPDYGCVCYHRVLLPCFVKRRERRGPGWWGGDVDHCGLVEVHLWGQMCVQAWHWVRIRGRLFLLSLLRFSWDVIRSLKWIIQWVLVDFHRFVVATDNAISELLPVSSAVPVLRGSDRWTHALCGLLGLVSFTHRSVLKAQCVVVSVSISLLFTTCTTWSYWTWFLSTH